MDKDFVREVVASGSAMLQEFAKAANSTGEHIYSVLVRQQTIDGTATIIGVIYFIISSFWFGRLMFRKIQEDQSENEYGLCWGLVLGIGLNFVLTIMIGVAIMQILNPEFYAIKFIFESVRGGK